MEVWNLQFSEFRGTNAGEKKESPNWLHLGEKIQSSLYVEQFRKFKAL